MPFKVASQQYDKEMKIKITFSSSNIQTGSLWRDFYFCQMLKFSTLIGYSSVVVYHVHIAYRNCWRPSRNWILFPPTKNLYGNTCISKFSFMPLTDKNGKREKKIHVFFPNSSVHLHYLLCEWCSRTRSPEPMVHILDGSSDYDPHVWSKLGNVIWLRHLSVLF